MPNQPRTPTGGGVLIAVGAIAGPLIGAAFHQATIGFLVGTGGAIVLSLVLWWRERER